MILLTSKSLSSSSCSRCNDRSIRSSNDSDSSAIRYRPKSIGSCCCPVVPNAFTTFDLFVGDGMSASSRYGTASTSATGRLCGRCCDGANISVERRSDAA